MNQKLKVAMARPLSLKRRAVFVLLAMLCFSTAWAQVSYRKYNTETGEFETKTSPSNVTTVTSGLSSMGATDEETWYVVSSNVTNENRIIANGTVHLILCDGYTFNSTKGINVSGSNAIYIYGQENGTGKLNATGASLGPGGECAGIGSNANGTVGTIVIHGGTINADNPGWSAGIGGGIRGGGGSVTIYGGNIHSIGRDGASEAIGHGQDGGTVARSLADGLCVKVGSSTTPVAYASRVSGLSNKDVTVQPCTGHSMDDHKCIYCGLSGYAVIYNANTATSGTVPVSAGEYLWGETATVLGNTGNLARNGCTFQGWNTKPDGSGTAYNGGDGIVMHDHVVLYAQLLPDNPSQWGHITIADGIENGAVECPSSEMFGETVILNIVPQVGYEVHAVSYSDGSGNHAVEPFNDVYSFIMPESDIVVNATFVKSNSVRHLAYNAESEGFDEKKATGFTAVTSATTTMGSDGATTWYAVLGNTTISSRIEVKGTVNLVLCDGATLTASLGMHVKSGVTLNIYAQKEGTGKLVTDKKEGDKACIGGDNNETGGDVSIHGGTVSAICTDGYGAGIGGGVNAVNGTVNIYGGNVTAKSAHGAAGIGGGCQFYTGNTCAPITILGGTIIAEGATPIGRGQGSSNGPLIFGHMKVFSNNNPVASGNRVSTCQTYGYYNSSVKIEPCTEHSFSDGVCAYCGATNQCILTYDGNGNSAGNVPDAEQFVWRTTVSVAGNTGGLEHLGCTFAGWNTKRVGNGTHYVPGATFAIERNTTLFAEWQKDPSQWRSITVADGIEHGSVICPGEAAVGVSVTLDVTPEQGYTIGTVTYNDGSDHEIPLVDGQYTFIMPSANVTVNVTFTGLLQDADGNYLISNIFDWNLFSVKVANGENFAGKIVKLMGDISVETKVGVVSDGTRQKPFSGTFDGGGKTITVNITDTNNQGTAPFCFIKNATIRNLTVTGTVTGNAYHASAIVGFNEGTSVIKNCVATATVNGSSHVGGILGHGLNSNITIDSCVFAGKIVGGNSAKGVLFGWGDNGGTKVVSNCLYVQQDGQDTSNLDLGKHSSGSESYTNCCKTANVGSYGTLVYTEAPSDILYKNQTITGYNFFRTCDISGVNDFYECTGSAITPALSVKCAGTELSADDYSVTFTHNGALANEVKEEGEYTMTVTGNEANGYYGTWSKTFKVCFGRDAEGNYIIANNDDWSFFASKITNGETFSGKTVKLASDEVTVTERVPNTFAGTFDGCGKTLTVNLSGGNEELAIFTTISNATIQNLHITGIINFARHRPASIASYVAGTSTVKNCWSDVNIISNYTSSDWVDGGALIARVNNGCTLNMSDCRFTGTFAYHANNHEGGGMVGWTQDANATANLTNCLFAPTSLTMTKENTKQLTYIFVSGNKRGILTNCFYNGVAANTTVLKKEGTRVFDEPQTTLCKKVTLFGTDYYAQCDVLGVEDYYCYNEGQTIELDTKVFAGSDVMTSEDYTLTMTYNGASATEVKERGEYVITITGNNGNEVFGTWSKTFHVVGLDHDTDGNYIIANADDWNTFATMVANVESFSGKTVKLANSDITVTTMVGTEANPFCGTFDGGGNTLTFNYFTNEDNAAPFQWIKNAVIKDMTVTGKITTSGMFAAGFVAHAHGDNAIENCVSSVTILTGKAGDCMHGGFVGRIESDCKTFTFTDCLFSGTFDGSHNDNWCPFAAWSMGESNTNLVFNDCLYAPTSVNVRNGSATFYCNGTPTLNGAYYTQALGTVQGSQVFTEVQTSLCKKVTLFGTDYYAACNISGVQTEYFCSEGKPVNVGLVVTCGGKTLAETDYTIAYTCNGEAVDAVKKGGEYVMTIAGNEEAGCFGTATASFTVLTDEDSFIVNYDLKDSYGDGWNGCAINVIEKASATTVNTLTINNGKSASGELMLDAGKVYTFAWKAGSWASETSWTFNDGDGDLLFSGSGGSLSGGYTIYQLLTSARPRDLSVTEPEIGDFELGWQSYEGHHDSWDVAYKSNTATDFTIVEGVTSNPYTLENLPVATEYTFKVRGRKEGLTTKWSDEVKFTMCEAITLANNATTNGALIVTKTDGRLCNVTLANRTIYRDGDWNTLVLPFEVDLTDEDSPLFGATARTLTSASLTNNGQTLTLNFDEPVNKLEAGVPYIIKWTEKCETDIVNPVFPYVTIDATDNTFCSDDRLVRFVGTYDLVTFDDENKDVLFLGGGNNLYYPDGKATTTIGACRAYFKIGNDDFVADAALLRSIVMDFGEESETVTIENVRVTPKEEIWFTLDGRRLKGKPNEKGLFIHNGKTVVE